MYELTRTEIDALLVRFDDLIRQAKAIQEQLQRALARSSELANRRPTGQPQDPATPSRGTAHDKGMADRDR